MVIYGICRSCKNRLSFEVDDMSRLKISKKLGKEVTKNCCRCGVTNTFATNQLKAKPPKKISRAILEASIVGLIIFIASFYFITTTKITIIAMILYTFIALGYIMYTSKHFYKVLAFNRSTI